MVIRFTIRYLANSVIAYKSGPIGNLVLAANAASAIVQIVTGTSRMGLIFMEPRMACKFAFSIITAVFCIRHRT